MDAISDMQLASGLGFFFSALLEGGTFECLFNKYISQMFLL